MSLLIAGQTRLAYAGPNTGQLRVKLFTSAKNTLVMSWHGEVNQSMTDQISEAIERYQSQAERFKLQLNSGGGVVREGERLIQVLQRLRQTHELVTEVDRGGTCGSMCVFIYVQGNQRIGALSSTWLFHEVSNKNHDRQVSLDRPQWERLIDKYFRPAGVSEEWIAEMKQHTYDTDYWQTGADLVAAHSGIITHTLGNERPRGIAGERSSPPPQATPEKPHEIAGEHGSPPPLATPGPFTVTPLASTQEGVD
jgi:ATP-dependent protease ClpP protease subunit